MSQLFDPAHMSFDRVVSALMLQPLLTCPPITANLNRAVGSLQTAHRRQPINEGFT
ncbi:hypothetical protein [Synechococcus sp. MIT S1220]|uniref:hypothetical protein n=1 Tax=Synechococcus sp. MIT S1220 TaxID=3082549 RepID=UPI0039AE9A9E